MNEPAPPTDVNTNPPAPLRFGVVGLGNIARQFTQGVAGASGDTSGGTSGDTSGGAKRSVITAVMSRGMDKAERFVADHALSRAKAYDDLDAMLADDSVDAVYLATPNHLHKQQTLTAIAAGKHVLCEKPLALSEADGAAMFDAAQAKGVTLMEAFMYRCHPMMRDVLAKVHGGAIGKVKLIRASFCYHSRKVEGNVRFDPSIGGGAVWDIGCYALNFARAVAGEEPTSIQATGLMHEAGVDHGAAAVLKFPSGILATLICSMGGQFDNTAMVGGEEGYLRVPIPWKPPVLGAEYEVRTMTPPKQDQSGGKHKPTAGPGSEVFRVDAPAPLYGHEADEFAKAVAGEIALPVTREDSLGNLRGLETILKQVLPG